MAIEIAELVAVVKAETAQFKKEMGEVEATTSKTSKTAGIAGLVIGGALLYGLDKSAQAAGRAQVETQRMDAAFKAAGIDTHDLTGKLDAAEASSRALGFSNEDVRNSLGTLATATHNSKLSFSDLSVAEDLSRFKHISLDSATQMLAKSMTGSSRAAKALGIDIIPVHHAQDLLKTKTDYATVSLYEQAKAAATLKDHQATMHEIIDKVSAATSGQADAFSKTAEGGMAVFHAQTGAIEESLGQALLPIIQKVTGYLATFSGYLSEHAGIVKVVVAVLGTLAVALGITAAATWAMNSALLASPITWIVAGIILVAATLVYCYKHFTTFREVVDAVMAGVKAVINGFIDFFTKTLPDAFKAVIGWVKDHWPEIVMFISGPFAPIVALATNAFGVRSALIGAFKDVWNFAKGLWNDLGAVWGAAWNGAWDLVKGAIDLMIGGINMLIGAWDSLHFHFGGIMGIGAFDVSVPQIPKIPMLGDGGIAAKAMLAVIGEKEPEAVVPLSRLAGLMPQPATAGAGERHLHVHFDGSTVVASDRQQLRRFAQQLEEFLG